MQPKTIYVSDDGLEFDTAEEAAAQDKRFAKATKAARHKDSKVIKEFLMRATEKEEGTRWPRGCWHEGDATYYSWWIKAPLEDAIDAAIDRVEELRARGFDFGLDQDVRIGKEEVHMGDHPKMSKYTY